MSKSERPAPVAVNGEIIHETDQAWLFSDGGTEVWLPKSQCKWAEDDKAMLMPEWLAVAKGLV